MRPEEAELIAAWVKSLKLPQGSVCLNIGSSTLDFRTNRQPHIERRLMEPLREIGIRIVHCDMKSDEGVDEVGDVLSAEFQRKLRAYDADLILCSNLLEHLTEPAAFARACGALVKPGGFGIFTVPSSYPYHPDPIDTMLRLKPEKLAAMLPDWKVVQAEEIKAGNHLSDLRASGEGSRRLLKQIGRILLPFYRSSHWFPIAHRSLWLFRPFRQSMVLLRKPTQV